MPDKDRFEKSIPSAWRKVIRLSKGGIASEAELGDACSMALAHSLRQAGGRAARSVLVQLSRHIAPHVSEAQLGQMISERTCIALVDHHFFGRARAHLVGERFSTFHEARAWEQAVKKTMSIGIQKLAARLWQDPSAARLRARKRTVARRPTRDLLNDPLT